MNYFKCVPLCRVFWDFGVLVFFDCLTISETGACRPTRQLQERELGFDEQSGRLKMAVRCFKQVKVYHGWMWFRMYYEWCAKTGTCLNCCAKATHPSAFGLNIVFQDVWWWMYWVYFQAGLAVGTYGNYETAGELWISVGIICPWIKSPFVHRKSMPVRSSVIWIT